jgi:DNA transformation protein
MAVDPRDLADFAERLAPLGPVRFKKMFGGAGFWLADEMFACWIKGSFMLRADAENAPNFQARGIGPWSEEMGPAKRVMTMPYYAIPDDVMGDDALLVRWAREAVAAADRAGQAKAAKKKPKTSAARGKA